MNQKHDYHIIHPVFFAARTRQENGGYFISCNPPLVHQNMGIHAGAAAQVPGAGRDMQFGECDSESRLEQGLQSHSLVPNHTFPLSDVLRH
jgi:hypothetical protein